MRPIRKQAIRYQICRHVRFLASKASKRESTVLPSEWPHNWLLSRNKKRNYEWFASTEDRSEENLQISTAVSTKTYKNASFNVTCVKYVFLAEKFMKRKKNTLRSRPRTNIQQNPAAGLKIRHYAREHQFSAKSAEDVFQAHRMSRLVIRVALVFTL